MSKDDLTILLLRLGHHFLNNFEANLRAEFSELVLVERFCNYVSQLLLSSDELHFNLTMFAYSRIK
jgi:hypothetical protein